MVAAAYSTEPFNLRESFAPRLPNLIGRQKFVRMIRQAIADDSGRSHVFYFVAAGGMGKTRLLEEVGALPGQQSGFLWSGIIDLYHSETHSPGGLRAAIARGFDPGGASFREYWELRQQFQDRRRAGEMGPALEALQQRLDEVFLEEYAALASQRRLVLCFDTLELIQYESDTVQQICQVDDISTLIKNWLVTYIPQLPNTVTIFAGRPRPDDGQQRRLDQEFQQAFDVESMDYHRESLNVLSDEEFQAYLEAMQQQRPRLCEFLNSPEIIAQISDLTARNPIRIGLVVDLLLNDEVLGDIVPAKLDKVWLSVVRSIRIPAPYSKILWFMLYARHGLDADLARYLINEPELESRLDSVLEEIGQLQFVKKHPGIRLDTLMTEQSLPNEHAVTRRPERTERLFLHDELYDMFDREHKSDPQVRREFQSFRNYYQQLEEQSGLLDEKKQDIRIALLYYELQVNANEAYHTCYARWDEEAIKGYETGYDMRLRDEVLRFMNRYVFDPHSPFHSDVISAGIDEYKIHRDCAVRWIKRHLARGEYKTANTIAEVLYHLQEHGFDWKSNEVEADFLYKASLLTTWAEVLMYKNAPEGEIRRKLEEAQGLLEVEREWSVQKGEDHWQKRILGRVYNNMGHQHWAYGRLKEAVSAYLRAIKHLREATINSEMADSINNLAYVYSLLGKNLLAERMAEDALSIRERLGQSHQIALSLNTYGLILLRADKPRRALFRCNKALEKFREVGDKRGIALSSLSLGKVYRALGNMWRIDENFMSEARSHYDNSIKWLHSAVDLIKEGGVEQTYELEAIQELASAHRSRGLLKLAEGDYENAEEDFRIALTKLEESIKLAGNGFPIQVANSMEDIADIHVIRGKLEEAETYLDRAARLIPTDYYLDKGRGFAPIVESIPEYWITLGKLHIQRAKIARKLTKNSASDEIDTLLDAVEHYALGVAYFLHASEEPYLHEETLKQIYGFFKIRSREILEIMKDKVENVERDYRIDLSLLKAEVNAALPMFEQ